MTKFVKALAAAAIATSAIGSAQAATLNTDVDVNLPSVVALYCYDSVSVTVDAAGLTTALGGDNGGVSLGSTTMSSFSEDLGADAGATAFGTTANLDINNVCAFRALVGSAGVNVSIDAPDTTLDHASAGVSMAAENMTLTSGAGGSNYDVTTGLGLGVAATPISVRVPLDLTNATEAGNYARADLFTITVVANP